MTTIMQPLQCVDLQPQIQPSPSTTHIDKTMRCRTQRRNPLRPERPQPQPPHTRGIPFIAGCSHFTQKNTRFRAPASSPKQSPFIIHAAITMRFAASWNKAASPYTHGNTRSQQSCNHTNAICNHRFKKRKELRTHRNNHSLQNAEEEHGGTHFTPGTTAASTAAHTRGTFHRRLQPLYTETYKEFRAPASSPTQASPLPFVTASLPNHFPSSPFP